MLKKHFDSILDVKNQLDIKNNNLSAFITNKNKKK